VRGKRDLKTAQKLRKKIQPLGISYGWIATDDRGSFVAVFAKDNHKTGKEHTVGIEGNNCRLKAQVRVRRARRACPFPRQNGFWPWQWRGFRC
jgi:IS1 family transposase